MERMSGLAASAHPCDKAKSAPGARSRVGRAFRRGGLVAVLASAMLALGAGGASAVITHLGSAKPISYQPLRGVAPSSVAPLVSANLIYHGGPVMTSNTNYAFYWA